MKKHTVSNIALALLFFSVVSITGCSIVGGLIGSIGDAGSKATTTLPGWQIASVKPGTNIEILGVNGHRVGGLYTGLQTMPYDEYASRFQARAGEFRVLKTVPAPGDSILVNLVSGKQEHGILMGYYLESMAVQTDPNGPTRPLPFASMLSIKTNNGDLVDPNNLGGMSVDGQLPLLTRIAYVSESEKRFIAVDDVDQISYRTSKNGALTGFLIGAAIDTGILIAVISAEKPKPKPRTTESCPLVYSFDGDRYILDSETFGGAIFEAAQRTDLDNLDYLTSVDGSYRLSLRNENDETEYVDKLSLLSVDHALNTRIVPSFSGELHVISNPRSPTAAVDDLGRDVLPAIQHSDSDVWISNPTGRNPEDLKSVRDGLELTFSRPTGTDQVKLVFTVQNTWWVPYLATQILELQGRNLDQWYGELNTSPEARSILFDAIIREGALGIEFWNGTTWQYGGFVWEVGPSLPKDLVVVLDLKDVEGDELRIRLESTAGLWMINSVLADFTSDDSIVVTEIFPQSAITEKGIDVREELSREDGSYYIMPTTEDRAELIFNAPQTDQSRAHTIILQTSGYYKVHLYPDGEPQKELANQLLTEPGAIGRFSVSRMNDLLRTAIAQR